MFTGENTRQSTHRRDSLAVPTAVHAVLRRRSSDSLRKKSSTSTLSSLDVPPERIDKLDDVIMFNAHSTPPHSPTPVEKLTSNKKPTPPPSPKPQVNTTDQLYHYLTPSWWTPALGGVTALVIWNGFKEQTTAHGIPRLAMAKGILKTSFWGISLAIAVALMLYNFSSITIKFFSYDTNVMLRLQNENQLQFPVVTLCNMNPLRRSALEGSGILGASNTKKRKKRATSTSTSTSKNTSLRSKRAVDSSFVTSSRQCCCTCCHHTFYYGGVLMDCNTCGSEDISTAATCAQNARPPIAPTTLIPPTTTTTVPPTVAGSQFPERIQTREEFQLEEKLTEAVAQIGEEAKSQLGYQSSDMIIDCQYSGADCNISTAFSKFYNPTHGNCFMFNSGWYDDNPVKKASKTGRRYGLHMIININQAEYTTQGGDTAGIRMLIHPQDRMPFPEDEGITVSPGHATSVGIRQVLMTRESQPYGDCINPTTDHKDINVYEELYPVAYSTSACQKTCYQKHVIQKCGCGDSYFPLHGVALSETPVKPCNSSDIIQDDCKYGVSKQFNSNQLKCSCPDSCTDMAFSNEVSLGQWPAEMQKDAMLEKYKEKIGSSFDIKDENAYKQNLIKLEVYYEEFNFETIDEIPGYKPGRYVSDIGGVLGLWIGFSILTIAEFIEVGMDMLVYMSTWLNRRKNGQTPAKDKDANKTASATSQLRGSARWYHVQSPTAGSKQE